MDNVVQLDKGEGRKLRKPNNIIPIILDNDFYKWWCIFLRPFVELTNKEIDVISCFLRHRFELSKIIGDESLIDTVLMSEKIKDEIIKECGMTKPYFYVIMSNLRKHGIITNKGINPRLVPNIRPDDDGVFQLLILFKEPDKNAKNYDISGDTE